MSRHPAHFGLNADIGGSRRIARSRQATKTWVRSDDVRVVRNGLRRSFSLLHRALIVESVLAVFNDRGDRFEHINIAILYRFLQVEVLNRNMIIAEPKLAAHGVEVGLFHNALLPYRKGCPSSRLQPS